MMSFKTLTAMQMVQAFRGLVGRAYRGVNAHDQVPALPPLSQFRHVGYGVWIDNGVPKLQVGVGSLSSYGHLPSASIRMF